MTALRGFAMCCKTLPGADPFLLNFHALAEKMGGEHRTRLAKKIIRDAKTTKLALGIDHDAKKLDHALANEKAAVPSHVYSILSPQPPPRGFLRFGDHQKRQGTESHQKLPV